MMLQGQKGKWNIEPTQDIFKLHVRATQCPTKF